MIVHSIIFLDEINRLHKFQSKTHPNGSPLSATSSSSTGPSKVSKKSKEIKKLFHLRSVSLNFASILLEFTSLLKLHRQSWRAWRKMKYFNSGFNDVVSALHSLKTSTRLSRMRSNAKAKHRIIWSDNKSLLIVLRPPNNSISKVTIQNYHQSFLASIKQMQLIWSLISLITLHLMALVSPIQIKALLAPSQMVSNFHFKEVQLNSI